VAGSERAGTSTSLPLLSGQKETCGFYCCGLMNYLPDSQTM
jgi:hypothetical protein